MVLRNTKLRPKDCLCSSHLYFLDSDRVSVFTRLILNKCCFVRGIFELKKTLFPGQMLDLVCSSL